MAADMRTRLLRFFSAALVALAVAAPAMGAGSCASGIQRRIQESLILPAGSGARGLAIIRLHIELKRDGYLLRPPAVMDPSSSPAQQLIAKAALLAVERGQPYNIPPQKYELCRDIILQFDPRDMYGR